MADSNNITKVRVTPNLDDLTIWKDCKRFWAEMTAPLLKNCARVFVQTASKYSPPGHWKKKSVKRMTHTPQPDVTPKFGLGNTTIPHEYYFCKIVDLEAARKATDPKDRPHKEDYEWIKQGYKFKVIRNKYREKMKTIGYARNLVYAKHMARITNRGLTKYSWGTILNNFEQNITQRANNVNAFYADNNTQLGLYQIESTPTFRILAQKSPNITKYKWGFTKIYTDDVQNGKWKMHMRNNLVQEEAFCDIAMRLGYRNMMRTWKDMIKKINTGSSGLKKFVKTEINKILINGR